MECISLAELLEDERRIVNDIRSIEEKISIMEKLFADPERYLDLYTTSLGKLTEKENKLKEIREDIKRYLTMINDTKIGG